MPTFLLLFIVTTITKQQPKTAKMLTEVPTTTYHYALTEIYNEALHGRTEDSSPDIDNRLLCSYTFDPEEIMAEEYEEVAEQIRQGYHRVAEPRLHEHPHPTVSNYPAIIRDPKYYELQFVVAEELPTGEYVATIKTGLIKRLQRRWKNKLKERERIIKARATPAALHERETTGKWPKHLRSMP